MKNQKKLMSLVVAAVMALGIIFAPTMAMAKNAPTIGKKDLAVFRITSVEGKTIRMVGTTAKGKKVKSFTVTKNYKLDKTYTVPARKPNYTVTRIVKNAFKGTKATRVILPTSITKIDPSAFKGSKAKVIKIKANLKPAKAKNMLKGSKATKVTIQVPKKQVKAWKKYAKAGKLGMKGAKVTIKSL